VLKAIEASISDFKQRVKTLKEMYAKDNAYDAVKMRKQLVEKRRELEKILEQSMTEIENFIEREFEVKRKRREQQTHPFFYDLMDNFFMIVFMLLVGFLRQTKNHWLMAGLVALLPSCYFILYPFAKHMSFINDGA